MGFNTTVVIRNDALDQIASDPNFGKKLCEAVLQTAHCSRPVEVPAGNHANAAQVIESHHADATAVVTVGGNHGGVQVTVGGSRHTDDTFRRKLVRRWAEELGMTVVEDLPSHKISKTPQAGL